MAVVDPAVIEEGSARSSDATMPCTCTGWAACVTDGCSSRYGYTLDGTGFTISTERDFGGCRMVGIPRTL